MTDINSNIPPNTANKLLRKLGISATLFFQDIINKLNTKTDEVESATEDNIATFNSSGRIKDSGVDISTDGTMSDNSDSSVPTEKAVVTYVAAESYTDEEAQDAVGTILTDTATIDFTYTDATPKIEAAVIPGGVDHDSLLNFVGNEHIDHTGVTLGAGTGLTGGGDISADRSFHVDVGIADDKILQVDDASAADDEYCKFTVNGVEGRTYAEVRSDINVADGADVTGSNAPQAHKDSHDPQDGSDPLDCAAAGEIVGVAAAAEGSAHSFARSDHTHQVQHSIADNHVITVDDADAASGDVAYFTASGLAGYNEAEFKTAYNMEAGTDYASPPTEDDFTVTLVCGTSGTISLSTNTLRYIKEGNKVTVSGTLVVDSVSSPVGDLYISGLPYTVGNDTKFNASISIYSWNWSAMTMGSIIGLAIGNTSRIYIRGWVDGDNNDAMAQYVQATTSFVVGGSYFTA